MKVSREMPPLKRDAFSLLENFLDKWQDRGQPRRHPVPFVRSDISHGKGKKWN
jgi:hypothetical protein